MNRHTQVTFFSLALIFSMPLLCSNNERPSDPYSPTASNEMVSTVALFTGKPHVAAGELSTGDQQTQSAFSAKEEADQRALEIQAKEEQTRRRREKILLALETHLSVKNAEIAEAQENINGLVKNHDVIGSQIIKSWSELETMVSKAKDLTKRIDNARKSQVEVPIISSTGKTGAATEPIKRSPWALLRLFGF